MLARLTGSQATYYLHWLPLIEARRHYGIAKLAADVKNLMGGKPARDTPSDKLVPLDRLYTADEELPFYAYFDAPASMDVATARDLVDSVRDLPIWAREIAPLDEARRILAIA